jgi:translation initiation factor 1
VSDLFEQLKNLGFNKLPDSQPTDVPADTKPDTSVPVKIQRQTKGRAGKGVTVIMQLPDNQQLLESYAKQLRKQLSVGGAVKDGTIELQGDQRQAAKSWLEQQGFTVKLAGG